LKGTLRLVSIFLDRLPSQLALTASTVRCEGITIPSHRLVLTHLFQGCNGFLIGVQEKKDACFFEEAEKASSNRFLLPTPGLGWFESMVLGRPLPRMAVRFAIHSATVRSWNIPTRWVMMKRDVLNNSLGHTVGSASMTPLRLL